MENPISPRPQAKRRVMVFDPLDLDPIKQSEKQHANYYGRI